jgi:uncharacterized membrane protein
MGNKPMFVFAGVYEDAGQAEDDYEAVMGLHSAGIIGSCDAAIISREHGGSVKVTKSEKPTQHGAWLGLAAGAAVAVATPVAMPGLVAAGGAGIGAWIAHVARGLSRSGARELGKTLEQGTTALIVIGVNKDADRVQKAAARAVRHTTRRIEGDYEEAEHEALATMIAA